MDNLRAITLMIVSMGAFAIEDMFVKMVSVQMPTGQILMLLGLGGALIFAAIARRQGHRLWTRDFLARAVVIRNLGEVTGTLCFVTAIVLTPLSSASAILQATPLAVTLGAALFLAEPVGWRRWSAIVVGFAGVLMVVRPGLEGFVPASLFAVAGVAGLATRDLATRAAPRHIGTAVLSTYGFGMLVPAGGVLLAVSGGAAVPDAVGALQMLAALLTGVAGYYAIVTAMRIGDVAVVTPFRYARLLFALILGIAVFGERPDAWTLGGAAIIIGSGLYTFLRERRLGRMRASPAAPPLV